MEPKIIVRKPTPAETKTSNAWGTWEKEPSEFGWQYDKKETCLILSGKASVKTKEGNIASFGAGDWVVFPQGISCTWKISEKITKKYKFG